MLEYELKFTRRHPYITDSDKVVIAIAACSDLTNTKVIEIGEILDLTTGKGHDSEI